MNRRKFLRCFVALPALPVAIVATKALAALPAPKPVWRKIHDGILPHPEWRDVHGLTTIYSKLPADEWRKLFKGALL